MCPLSFLYAPAKAISAFKPMGTVTKKMKKQAGHASLHVTSLLCGTTAPLQLVAFDRNLDGGCLFRVLIQRDFLILLYLRQQRLLDVTLRFAECQLLA